MPRKANKPDVDNSPSWTTAQVRERLPVSYATLARYRKSKILRAKFVQAGVSAKKTWFYVPADVEKLLIRNP